MENSLEEPPQLSTRSGALVLKSISLFLTANRNSKSSLPDNSKTKQKRKVMSNKDAKCPPRIYEMAKRDTHFLKNEIIALYKIYRRLVGMKRPIPRSEKAAGGVNVSLMGKPTIAQEGIDRSVFRELLHNTFDLITEDMLMDRIFCVWDKSNAGLLTLETWFSGLSTFLKGTINEKLEFCFHVYDLNSDGYVTKDEMFQLLRNCLIKQPQDEDPDEGAKDLAEIVMRKLDKDKDGKISLEDYQSSILEEPLLLEAFGRCLPDERACNTFLSTMRA
ncbi:EF-hand calcium-binding domain-containing protein 1 isoform X2 [Photinus pyralis]|nr:EF-hand calcium-binding domain-containing protein 1 isoform X2 [Photinus pyralis]